MRKFEKEPEITGIDGTVRKAHYGEGKQPWDVWKEIGWAHVGAATNAHKYVARHQAKNGMDDLEKARWYYSRLCELSQDERYPWVGHARDTLDQLINLLTPEQLRLLGR